MRVSRACATHPHRVTVRGMEKESGPGYLLGILFWFAVTTAVIWQTVGLIVALLMVAVVLLGIGITRSLN